jgi:ABC-type multidrug transport system fused ATPase/permease subunit
VKSLLKSGVYRVIVLLSDSTGILPIGEPLSRRQLRNAIQSREQSQTFIRFPGGTDAQTTYSLFTCRRGRQSRSRTDASRKDAGYASLKNQLRESEYTPDRPLEITIYNRGEDVAIVGASAAGKSTLVNLVPRFFDVSSGAIRIDGRNLREYTLESLRRQIAVVTQDVIPFDDTIHAKIADGDSSATAASVRKAAQAALTDDFVSAFPEKYETRIGERGLRLSGGERQRISIARAILKNAPFLILDQATSSLDSESEIYVQRALQNLMEGRTTIVIGHRHSTIRRADRIVVLSEGRICESGTHDDLIARQGVYWKLHSLQFPEEV